MKRKKKKREKACPNCGKDGKCRICKGTGKVRIVRARQKGQTFERAIAKQITDWSGIECRRTPLSGGWNKIGDVTPKDPKQMSTFPFTLELKNQESWTPHMFLKISNSKDLPKMIANWWNQCCDDAKKSKRKVIPLLLFTKANYPVFLMLKTNDFLRLHLHHLEKPNIVCGDLRVMLWEELVKIPYDILVDNIEAF